MKRIMMTLLAVGLIIAGSTSSAAGDDNIRKEARFLADKIAYELKLNKDQLNDAFEINYDFLKRVYPILDALAQRDEDAIREYYRLLSIRNGDLLWIIDHKKFEQLLDIEYLYRPVYLKDGKCQLRVYSQYKNQNKFLVGKPKSYSKYKGDHFRENSESSFYRGHYKHVVYGAQRTPKSDRLRTAFQLDDFPK